MEYYKPQFHNFEEEFNHDLLRYLVLTQKPILCEHRIIINYTLKHDFLKVSNLAHDQVYVKHPKSINNPDTFDDIKMGLPPVVKAQNERERDNGDQVINEIITNVTLGDLLHVTSWHRLTFFRELSKKLERN